MDICNHKNIGIIIHDIPKMVCPKCGKIIPLPKEEPKWYEKGGK